MITFEQLKEVLLKGEIEILQDDYIDELNREQFEFHSDKLFRQFHDAKTLLDLIHIYEGRGFETYEANECIINTMMQLASFN
jgi:hypothetical protein